MTSIEAFKTFEIKLNNLALENTSITYGEFVLIFNEQQNKWFESKIRNKSSRFSLDDVQNLIVKDTEFKAPVVKDRFVEVSLPEDYADYIRSYVLADKKGCKNRIIRTYQVRNEELEYVLRDEFSLPSFEYAETPVTLSDNKLQIYKTDFSIGSVFITYYRYPKKIDIEGYTNISGNDSVSIDPELKDVYVHEIIDLCVLEVHRNFENTGGFNLSANRIKE